jgi:hypothetical protein
MTQALVPQGKSRSKNKEKIQASQHQVSKQTSKQA